MDASGGPPPHYYERFYAVIRRVPRGRVATYGQIARLAGLPRHARHVGHALFSLPPGSNVPWQRVLNAKGELSLSGPAPHLAAEQRARLEREGVRFDARGRVPLRRFGWEK